jgi:5-methylcytosine-specific restriction protein A
MAVTAVDFQSELDKIFQAAQKKSASFVIVISGDLHRRVGGYPGAKTHRMPICCKVMRENMKSGDIILQAPPKGNGASLEVKYILPR